MYEKKREEYGSIPHRIYHDAEFWIEYLHSGKCDYLLHTENCVDLQKFPPTCIVNKNYLCD